MTLISSEIWPKAVRSSHISQTRSVDTRLAPTSGWWRGLHSGSTPTVHPHEGGNLTGILKAENPRSRNNKRKDRKKKGVGVGVEGTMDKERANSRNRHPFTPPAVTRVECRARASKTVVCCLLPVSSSTPNPQEGRYPVSFEHHHKP